MTINIAITKNIMPLFNLPARTWPRPGIKNDKIAAINGLIIIFFLFD